MGNDKVSRECRMRGQCRVLMGVYLVRACSFFNSAHVVWLTVASDSGVMFFFVGRNVPFLLDVMYLFCWA